LYTKLTCKGVAETKLGERPRQWRNMMRKTHKPNRSGLGN